MKISDIQEDPTILDGMKIGKALRLAIKAFGNPITSWANDDVITWQFEYIELKADLKAVPKAYVEIRWEKVPPQ